MTNPLPFPLQAGARGADTTLVTGMLRLVLGISAAGWFGLGLNEWLRSRRRTSAGADGFRMPASTRVSESARRAA